MKFFVNRDAGLICQLTAWAENNSLLNVLAKVMPWLKSRPWFRSRSNAKVMVQVKVNGQGHGWGSHTSGG